MQWRTVHLAVGLLGILLFILQGQYMARVLDVPGLEDGMRLMYRSSHIYLLLASVANVCIGSFMHDRPSIAQRIAGLLLMLGPPLLLYSFFAESTVSELHRPVSVNALYLVFGAAVLLLLDAAVARLRGRTPRD